MKYNSFFDFAEIVPMRLDYFADVDDDTDPDDGGDDTDPDDGGDDNGKDDKGKEGKKAEKTFTQSRVNAMLAANKREANTRIKELEKQLAGLKKTDDDDEDDNPADKKAQAAKQRKSDALKVRQDAEKEKEIEKKIEAAQLKSALADVKIGLGAAGVVPKRIERAATMIKLSDVLGADGDVDKDLLNAEIEDLLEDMPELVGKKAATDDGDDEDDPKKTKFGSKGKGKQSKTDINDALDKMFGIKKDK